MHQHASGNGDTIMIRHTRLITAGMSAALLCACATSTESMLEQDISSVPLPDTNLVQAVRPCSEPGFLVRDLTETWGRHSYLVGPCGVAMSDSEVAARSIAPAAPSEAKTANIKAKRKRASDARTVNRRRSSARADAHTIETGP